MSSLQAKKAVGQKAAQLVLPEMIIGLGSGSTSECFIEALIERLTVEEFSIQAVSSSAQSAEMARKGGIEIVDLNAVDHIDITFDGADEIDPRKRMIKGGGGAHLREKILAAASDEMVVLVDETKWVDRLGKRKLPVEILPYGSEKARLKIEDLGVATSWRIKQDGSLFVTDNGNLLLDIAFPSPPPSVEEVDEKLLQIPGVLETGFFFNLAGRVLTGHADGRVSVKG